MKQKLLMTAILCAASPLTHAQVIDSIDAIVVTATRMPQPLNKTIADTTVLNEQEIRHSGAPDVPTLLRSLAGVEVVQSGSLGAQSSTFMRGSNSNQVLVLLDGVRINSATTGATALEHIMLDNIERIEVVRGNVSSLYGSEAIGGVIQLFTKHGKGAPTFNASAGLGNYGTQRLAAGFSGAAESTSFSLNAGRVRTDGVSAMNPTLASNANPNNNGYDNNTFSAQIKHAFNTDHALSATWFSARGEISFDNNFGATNINNTQTTIDKISLASDDQINEKWHSTLRLAQGSDDSQTYTNGTPAYRYKTQSNQYVWQNNLKLSDDQQLSLSAENLTQLVSSNTLYAHTTRNVNSLSGGYTGEFGQQQIQFNLRQDSYSDFGTVNTGLLGYGFAFSESWRVTGSVSNAFKAPTFNDMYDPYLGNPALKPERSQNDEVGLHYTANGHRVDAIYFDNRITDFITLNSAYVATNTVLAQITGQEFSYAGDFGNSHIKANATFQNPRDTTTGLVLARRAKEFASAAATHDFNALNVGVEMRYSGERQDGSHTLSSYSLFNLSSRYTLDKHWNLSARINNVFNTDYSEAYSYNTLGRNAFIGISYQ